MAEFDKQKVVDLLNRILEQELAGVVRYTHYSLLIFGYSRIPVVEWFRAQAAEALTHAQQAGEMYKELPQVVEGRSVMLEEYARQMVFAEEMHAGEVDKMMRKPGEINALRPV